MVGHSDLVAVLETFASIHNSLHKPMKCKARQGNAKRVRSGILAENTAVLAGDFKINFGQFPGPSFLQRPGPMFSGPCSCPHHSQALERPMIHARVITSTRFGEGTSWTWVVVGFWDFGPGLDDTRGSCVIWIKPMASVYILAIGI